jgi:hypothetical protein
MRDQFVSILGLGLACLPALVVAQNVVTPTPPVEVPAKAVDAPAPVIPPVVAPVPATQPDVTVNIGGAGRPNVGIAPLPKVELPEGMVAPPAPVAAANPSLLPPRPAPPAPPAKLTPAQIAQQIAPNFNVSRDYVRLTQCYGIADFMGAVTRIQASRPGATPQIVGVARSIGGLQDAMQPMVLAASTVRGEARFRADYDAIARNGQRELATSRTPNVTMQRRLATLDACRGDVSRWRGGR